MKRIVLLSVIILFPFVMIAQTAEEYYLKGKNYYEGTNGVSKDYAEAYKWFSKAAEMGNANAMNGLGLIYEFGRGVTKDYNEAAKWYRKSAEQGYAKGQANMGYMYEAGNGVEKDYNEAAKWYRKAAEQGYARGQANLGYMYEYGYGVNQDYAEAAKWYRKAAEQGYARGQSNLGIMYENGRGVSKDYAEAAKWYSKAAEQGYAKAQNNLGNLYLNGNGVTKDYNEAIKWFRKAAEQNYASGQANLGYMFEEGYGVNQDYAEALKWYRKAAEQNNLWTLNKLGLLYMNGEGVTKDYNEAIKWFRKAAEQNYASGKANLGYMFEKGYGVNQDYAEALKWYRKAAEQNNLWTLNELGLLYKNGEGVTKDYDEALKWFSKAAELGYARAQYNIGDLYRDGLGVKKDYAEAVKWYRKATDQGNLNAQVSLGWMYENGYGVVKDITEAVKLYLSAAERGDRTAQSNMGVMYENGTGVEQDYKEAIKWYRKAIENGGIAGKFHLGRMYEDGKGVRKSYTIAMEWYQKAANQGEDRAMRRIGMLYENGNGVPKNFRIAEEWYKKAIDNAPTYGNSLSNAQTSLAKIQQKIANEPAGSDALKVTDELVKLQRGTETQQQKAVVQQETIPPTTKSAPKFPIIDYVNNSLKFIDPSGSDVIKTNGNYKIQFQIQNSGNGEAKGCLVKVSAKGDTKDINFKDLSLNTISPKETITVDIPISSGTNISNGQVEFTIQVDEPNGFGTDPQYITVTTRGFEAPLVKIADYSLTGSNGKELKKKQPFDLQLLLQNTKYGQADDVTVNVELPQNVVPFGGDQLNMSFAKLAGGESKSLVYSLIVNNNYSERIIPIKIHLKEKYGKYAEDRTISLNLDQDFAKSKLTVTENRQVRPALEKQNAGSDVDKDIPQTEEQQKNTFAVIITNEDYKYVDPVPYARNDGEIFMAYCKETLGIPEEHFIICQDATYGDFHSAISTIKGLSKAFEGNCNVIFYYAGHGIPNDQGSESYLLPIDGDSKIVDVCYPVSRLFQELGDMNANKVLVFLDACFSGAKRGNGTLNKARGVAIKPKNQQLKGNMIVFSATTGDEAAYPYEEQEHGLFTYFLLKKLKESGGNCTLGELGQYLKQMVLQKSMVVNHKSQTPTVRSSDIIGNTWQQMKLNHF